MEKKEDKKEEFIDIDDFAKVELYVGKILECHPVEGSDKLYKLIVDLGLKGTRQVLAGVAKFFIPKDLINKQGVYVTNLKPRKMVGLLSEGMMLFARDINGNVQMATVGSEVENGTRLS